MSRRWLSPSRPRVRLFKGFLRPAECATLRAAAASHLRPVEIHNEFNANATRRSAHGAWLPRSDVAAKHALWRSLGFTDLEAEVISRVERRIANAAGIPLIHGEPSQIIRYRAGSEYTEHPDYFDPHDTEELANGGQRVATFLVYLSTVASGAGGHTVFARASDGPLRIRPREGDAVLWHNVLEDGRPDVRSVHSSETVKRVEPRAEKWVLSKWLRQRPYEVDVAAFRHSAAQQPRRKQKA